MSGDVAIESRSTDSPLTNVDSSPSQTSDTAGAADDRVFFGPLQSPEKKFALSLGGPKFRTPIRRSTRLSSAMVPLPLFPEEHEAEASSTREASPEEDTVPDEPSVILASRVLSACSNPSPPPSPPLPPQHPLFELDDIPLADLSASPPPSITISSALGGPLIDLDDLTEPVASSSPFLPRVPTPTQQQAGQANTSQPDLIAFDSFSTPNASPINALSGSTPSCVALAKPVPTSVDDLLSMSPQPSPPVVHDKQTNVLEHPEKRELNATPEHVAASLVTQVDHSSQQHEENHLNPSSPVGHPTAPKEQTPPLRRSTRPRKSRSSLPQTIVNTSPQPPPPQQPPAEAESSSSEQSDEPRLNAQRKRKLKLSPRPEDKREGTSTDAPTTPRRLPQVAFVQRELGSLSPLSAAVLSQLLPNAAAGSASGSSTPLPPSNDAAPDQTVLAPAQTTPPQQPSAFIFPRIEPTGDPAPGAPRPRSPLRPFSPSKFGEDSRTPARRVPIAQAVAEGTYSPNKLPAAFGAARPTHAPSTPVFKKFALDDPLRSPARRVPMSEAVPLPPPSPGKAWDKGKGKAIPRLQSPVRALSVPPRDRERSTSVESQPFSRRERGASAEPTARPSALGRRPLFQKPTSSDGVPGSAVKPRTVLPFPLVQQQRVPPIPEGEEPGLSPVRPALAAAVGAGLRGASAAVASPAKQGSSLRQPSAGSGSRIPRIGAKPYARPKSAPNAGPASKSLTSAKGGPMSSKTQQPLRIVNVGSSSGSSSDEGPASSNAPAVIPAVAFKPRRALGAQPSTSSVEGASVTANGLKRKREMEASSLKPAAPVAPQKIVMRKVVPGMFNKGKEPATPQATVSQPAPAVASPTKASGPIKARSAVGWKRPQQEPSQPPPTAIPAPVAPPERLAVPSKEPSPELVPSPAAPEVQAELEMPIIEPAATPLDPATATTGPVAAAVPPASTETTAGPAAQQPSTRRSTRSKRSTTTTTDVFGSVAATGAVRTTQRRRGPLPSETNGPFAGMSALALKTLTSANTVRNQRQVVTIQTEVVRKEGNRPDSPTTRVRSTLEKQKEERVQQRQQRAERRARRSAGSDVEGLPAANEDGETGTDAGDVSAMSVDEVELPLRHRRGPGDEEEYETPPRAERPIKRPRFDGGTDEDGEGEQARDVQDKRVKWHKGLHTTVLLDDTPPKPKWDTKAVPSSKSCFTPAAKAVRLDTLGNALNAEVPVSGLVKENIIVKKFVFDDDEVPAEAAPPPTPAAKSTRSRSKRAKS